MSTTFQGEEYSLKQEFYENDLIGNFADVSYSNSINYEEFSELMEIAIGNPRVLKLLQKASQIGKGVLKIYFITSEYLNPSYGFNIDNPSIKGKYSPTREEQKIMIRCDENLKQHCVSLLCHELTHFVIANLISIDGNDLFYNAYHKKIYGAYEVVKLNVGTYASSSEVKARKDGIMPDESVEYIQNSAINAIKEIYEVETTYELSLIIMHMMSAYQKLFGVLASREELKQYYIVENKIDENCLDRYVFKFLNSFGQYAEQEISEEILANFIELSSDGCYRESEDLRNIFEPIEYFWDESIMHLLEYDVYGISLVENLYLN